MSNTAEKSTSASHPPRWRVGPRWGAVLVAAVVLGGCNVSTWMPSFSWPGRPAPEQAGEQTAQRAGEVPTANPAATHRGQTENRPAAEPVEPLALRSPFPGTAPTASTDLESAQGPPLGREDAAHSVWTALARGMQLHGSLPDSHKQVRKRVRDNQHHWGQVVERARFYLPHIAHAVLERGLPAELALIPAIESGFRSDSRSPLGAVGLWQFMPRTARAYGLRRTWWYEGRRDPVAATAAALRYLSALNDRFEGNWLLTIAAYNCGEGNMRRALRRAGATPKDADIWSFLHTLPKETQRYLPRLLAVAEMVVDPTSFGQTLPAISAADGFVAVRTHGQVDLSVVAKAADLEERTLAALNPALLRWATDPQGPHRLIVPREVAVEVQAALDRLPADARMRWSRHTVVAGESLSTIGARHGVRVAELMRANQLKSTTIRAGAVLRVPYRDPAAVAILASAERERRSKAGYEVQSGDSLWLIARRYDTTVARLVRLNRISRARPLRPGQWIVLPTARP